MINPQLVNFISVASFLGNLIRKLSTASIITTFETSLFSVAHDLKKQFNGGNGALFFIQLTPAIFYNVNIHSFRNALDEMSLPL